MAKKDNKKGKAAAKPAKKAAKPAAKKVEKKAAKKPAKPAPKKAVKPAAKKVEKKATKPAPKKVAPKPVAKKVEKKVEKKPAKPVAKKEVAKAGKKPVGKPIDAIKKKGKPDTKGKKSSKKSKGEDDEDFDEEDIEDEEEEDGDVDVKDDYEKAEDDDVLVGELDEAGLVDLEGGDVPDLDDDDDEEPIKRGRGRRKKNEGKSSGGSMEAYIRNRPLQVDLSKPLIKKQSEKSPKPFVNTKDNRSRYTDKELAEFKELILEKLKEAQTDYDLLKQTLSNEDNHGTDDTSPTFKLLEDGSDVMSKEETAQLASRQEKYIINLKNALVRIENKSYGICRVTGKLIPKERLRSVPHATLSIDAKLNQSS
ncbi:MAG: TraR/DksA family transcriptional regulator [Sphingobacteriaceae bacterium]